MWVFERDGILPAYEETLEAVRRCGKVGSVCVVYLRCVKQELQENTSDKEEQSSLDLDCEVWRELPPELASRIIFGHRPLEDLLAKGWPVAHLINFPPIQKHALLVGNVVFHNFSARKAELPRLFTSARPLALSPQGFLVVACFSNKYESKLPGYLACCHLPSATTFSLVKLPKVKSKPVACQYKKPGRSSSLYAHVFHPNKLHPASSYTLILVLGKDLLIFTSGDSKWKLFTEQPPCMMFYSGFSLFEENTLPEVALPTEFLENSGVVVQGPDKRFKFRYGVCMSRFDEEVGVLCCMRLDTLHGEWEVMPGPPRSVLQEVNLRDVIALDGEYEQGVAVFEDTEKGRLVIGFVEPWEWVISTTIINLEQSSSCKRGSVQLLLPSSS